ncbi:hypothetical protein B0G81_5960 [Paraburkholderia sp. BL6665CI2N2]|uniref:hypothetical protein n=1 Tax=Paraburkholderia sp. BL6665CI2N2 TaxID=1938806 RepID=UPI001066DC4D|nr:hypothetical protein [Paraburkholderia sp. BL6665CI2N2]TDY25489.1 hypothetical protein B0G81_5960 [Paraburkholderia sp. BL6665CI2N2]
MSDSSFLEQVSRCADKIGSNDMMRAIMAKVWHEFEQSIAPNSSYPLRLRDLDVPLLAGFVEARSKQCLDVELLLLEITCIRMVLLESGFLHNQLSELSVRVKRHRLANDEKGKYRFAKKLCI